MWKTNTKAVIPCLELVYNACVMSFKKYPNIYMFTLLPCFGPPVGTLIFGSESQRLQKKMAHRHSKFDDVILIEYQYDNRGNQ